MMNARLLKLITATLSMMLLASVTGAIESEVRPYVSFSGGYAYLENMELNGFGTDTGTVTLDGGYIVEGAIGLVYNQFADTANIRAELAFSYQQNDLDEYKDKLGLIGPPGTTYSPDGEVDIYALMLNGYFDFYTGTIFSPYLMGGLGSAKVDADIVEDNVFAYQVGVGLGVALSDNIVLDLKYKYFMTEDPKESNIKINIDSSHFMAGLRLQF